MIVLNDMIIISYRREIFVISKYLSFVKDFLWVPIISAFVGGFITIFIPKLFLKIGDIIKHKVNKSVDIINIEGEWNSFFTRRIS